MEVNFRWFSALGTKPVNWATPLVVCLRFFDLNFEKDPVQSYAFRKFFHLLDSPELVEKAEEVEKFLKENHAYLFGSVTVKIGKEERTFVKGDLLAQSTYFEKENYLTIPEGVDDAISIPFLEYLATGNLNLDERTVVQWLIMGLAYQLTLLSKNCMLFIQDGIPNYDIRQLFEISLKYRSEDLLFVCKEKSNELSIEDHFKMAAKYKNYSAIQFCYESNYSPETFIEESLKYDDMNLKWYGEMLLIKGQTRPIMLHGEKTLRMSSLDFDLVKDLNDKYGVQSLELVNFHDDLALQQVASIIPALSGLSVMNCNITSIPESWCKSLKWVQLFSVPEMTKLILYNVETVQIIGDCPKLVMSSPRKAIYKWK